MCVQSGQLWKEGSVGPAGRLSEHVAWTLLPQGTSAVSEGKHAVGLGEAASLSLWSADALGDAACRAAWQDCRCHWQTASEHRNTGRGHGKESRKETSKIFFWKTNSQSTTVP